MSASFAKLPLCRESPSAQKSPVPGPLEAGEETRSGLRVTSDTTLSELTIKYSNVICATMHIKGVYYKRGAT